ncbi:MAG TPA: sigma factor, partial [Thermoleophilaceae bacterium]|nr:sigma factor [Thermoleophilaceae bacterium]
MTLDAGELPLVRMPPGHGAERGERALVRGAQAGSKSDLEELFRRFWPSAYRAAYFVVYDRAAAEDIAQEAFMSALRALDRFD